MKKEIMPNNSEWESSEHANLIQKFNKFIRFIKVEDRAVKILVIHVDRKDLLDTFGKEKHAELFKIGVVPVAHTHQN